MTRSLIKISGLRSPGAAGEFFASTLVDVAYLVPTGPDTADVDLDGIDTGDPDSRAWIADVLREAMNECGEPQAIIEFVADENT